MTDRTFTQAEVDALIAAAYEVAGDYVQSCAEGGSLSDAVQVYDVMAEHIREHLTPADARQAQAERDSNIRQGWIRGLAKAQSEIITMKAAIIELIDGHAWNEYDSGAGHCSCDTTVGYPSMQSWVGHLKKALAEHDAALLSANRMPCGHLRAELDTIRIGQGPGVGKQYCSGCEREAKQYMRGAEERAKLKAENAELREGLRWALDHVRIAAQAGAYHFEKREQLCALLAKSGVPK